MTSVRIGKLSEIADGGHRIVAIDSFEVGIFRQADGVVAWENRCPHSDGPVCQGKIFNRVEEVLDEGQKHVALRFGQDRHIVCPWHGWEFNLDTGRHPGDPHMKLKRVPAEVRDGDIFLDLPKRR
jgi:nitrite reductase (NADH) small subunit